MPAAPPPPSPPRSRPRLRPPAPAPSGARNDGHKQLIDQVEVWGVAAKTAPRILCGIYTYHNNHQTKVKVRVRTSEARRDAVLLAVRRLYLSATAVTPEDCKTIYTWYTVVVCKKKK